MKKYSSFAELDADLGFQEKAGFQMAELQVEDVETFATWPSYLNTYEVGGGKTVISTAVSLLKGMDVTIIIVPPILLRPWTRWLNKFGHTVICYEGRPPERKALHPALKTARWIVCSHAIFRMDFNVLQGSVNGRDYEILIDEAQAIKNIKSVLYRKVLQMSHGSDLGMLTGTPTNKPEDAYAYITLKTPGLYRNFSHFEAMHIEERDFFKRPKKYANMDLLAKNFRLRNITRTKKEVHGYDNPPNYPDCTYALSPEHQALYEKLVDEQLLVFEDGSKIDATTAQKLYHALQQIVMNPEVFSGKPDDRAAGLDLLDLTIEQTECSQRGKSKLIVWTIYKRTSQKIWDYINNLGIKTVAAFSGSHSQNAFDAFMEDPDTRVLVAQPSSAGAGLNPQAVCWESLSLEHNTIAMHKTQSDGRLDRMGQLHIPTIRMGVAEGTVQVNLLNQLLNNADLVARVEGNPKTLREILLGR